MDTEMKRISNRAEQRAQEVLDDARLRLREAERSMKELATSPLFGNGLGEGMREAHTTLRTLDNRMEGLKLMVAAHFKAQEPIDVER